MNRRRILNGVHRSIARKQGVNAVAWFSGQSFHQSAEDVPFERLPMKDLDKAGPRLVTTPPVEPVEVPVCIYCTSAPATDPHQFPYCSAQCAANARNS